jgi:hypothetical protein
VSIRDQRGRSREEAEIRKIEAEAAQIEARTALLYSAVLLLWLVPVVAMIFGALDPGHPASGPDLLSRWLPSLLSGL